MWPLLDALSKQCIEHYVPHRELSIDKSMIGTKCRLSFIQYRPKKPTKWGVKVWVCRDSHTGFIYSFDVYTGADPSKSTHPKGLAYDVVLGLPETRLGKGHAVYMDNFYSSPQLFVKVRHLMRVSSKFKHPRVRGENDATETEAEPRFLLCHSCPDFKGI